MIHFNMRENKVLSRLKRRLEDNIKENEVTQIDTFEIRLLDSLLFDIWVSEEFNETENIYLDSISEIEKKSLYGLKEVFVSMLEKFSHPEYVLGMGDSVLIAEILYSHLKMVKLEGKKEIELEKVSENTTE